MEQRISLITLGVADLDRSRAFYERLGWQRSARAAEGIVFFQAGGLASAGQGFAGITLAYNTRTRVEVDSVLAEAVAAGATLVKPAEEAFWGGYSGYFADPDGFPWEIAWNPSFSVATDGSLHLPE
jgi:uncharacterized protein